MLRHARMDALRLADGVPILGAEHHPAMRGVFRMQPLEMFSVQSQHSALECSGKAENFVVRNAPICFPGLD